MSSAKLFNSGIKLNKMKNYTVFHIEKGKGSGGALGNHIDRTEGKEHSFVNADISKTHFNLTAKLNEHSYKPLQQGIKDRINEGYKGKRKVRNNAVKYMKVILSGSHEKMKKIESEGRIKAWSKDSMDWLAKEFGKENIVKAVVHLDEKTPHIHAIIVPLIQEEFSYKNKKGDTITVQEGALSAKEILRSPSFFRDLHTDYAKKVGVKYGLMRGEMRKPGTEKTPVTTLNEFYHQVNKASDFRDLKFKIPTIEKPSRLVVLNPDNWTREQNERIKDSLSDSVSDMQERLDSNAFRTAAEVIRESKFKEDLEVKQSLIKSLKEAQSNTEITKEKSVVLNMKIKKLEENLKRSKNTTRGLLEGRYSKEQIKEFAKKEGIRLDSKGMQM
jgi:hypothetical protein